MSEHDGPAVASPGGASAPGSPALAPWSPPEGGWSPPDASTSQAAPPPLPGVPLGPPYPAPPALPALPARSRRIVRSVLAVAGALVVLVALGAVLRAGAPQTRPREVVRSGAPAAVSPAGGPIGYQSFDDGARQLLATMTSALGAHDAARFRSVASPGYPAMADRLGRMYRTLAALPLDSFSLAVDQSRSSTAVASPAPESMQLPVRVTYRLAGWDADDVTVPLTFVATRTPDGGWGLAQDRTTSDADTNDRLEPWEFDDTYVTSTPHVLVVGDRAHEQQARRLASTLETLVADVRRVWPERSWNGRVVAYALTSPAFVHSWYGGAAAGENGNGDRASFVAKVATLTPAHSGAGTGAVRMVVTPYLLGSPKAGYADVLRHEVTHVATAALSDGAPVWLVEGAAEYTGFARRESGDLDATRTFGEHGLTAGEVSATARGSWRPTLVSGDDFYTGSEKTVDERYNSAFITCLYIADHYGEATLRRLYEQAHTADEPSVLRQVLHTDRAHLTSAVGAYATTLRHRLVFR